MDVHGQLGSFTWNRAKSHSMVDIELVDYKFPSDDNL